MNKDKVTINNVVINNDFMEQQKEYKGHEKGSGAGEKIIVPIVLAIISLIQAIIVAVINNTPAEGDVAPSSEMGVEEAADKLIFDCIAEETEKVGLEYIEYEIASNPSLNGYHVRPYPYLSYVGKEGNIIIPLTHLFTEEEYSADSDGKCILLKEYSAEKIEEMYEPSSADTLLFIEYGSKINGEKMLQCYYLNDGELQEAEEEIVIQVLEAYENTEQIIDMSNWPKNMEKIQMHLDGS